MSIEEVKLEIRARLTALGFALAETEANVRVGEMTDILAEEILADAVVIDDHGMLSGLGDDDHTQYFNQTRGDARYLQAEVDPVFGASPAAGIISDNISAWNAAYGWGDHSGLYDTVGTAAGLVSGHESTYDHDNYDTAYGWGNHSGLYAPISGISNSHLGSLGNAGVHTKFAATGLADSLISETGTTINASCYDFIIPYTASTLARFMFLHPTWPTIWQNGIEMNWAAVPRITNVFSYSDVSDGLITLCVGTRAVPKICMMLRGGAGGDAVYDGNIGFGTTSIGQMQNGMITVLRSGNSATSLPGWPGMIFYNSLATKGNGTSTFNFAGCTFNSGDATVQGYFYTEYDDVYSGMAIGTATAHPFSVRTNGVERVKVASDGIVTIASLAGTGTRNVVVDANGVLSAP